MEKDNIYQASISVTFLVAIVYSFCVVCMSRAGTPAREIYLITSYPLYERFPITDI